jgi:hypothetical protein
MVSSLTLTLFVSVCADQSTISLSLLKSSRSVASYRERERKKNTAAFWSLPHRKSAVIQFYQSDRYCSFGCKNEKGGME